MPSPDSMRSSLPDQIIGRYALFHEIASGGMATVHLGRLLGQAGFSRVVAIKRLLPHLARDPEFVSMFVDEARLAARVQHPNVVPTLDVVVLEGELFIVMEYVEGESISRLVRLASESGQRIPIEVTVAIVSGALHGLHAAHEARGEDGRPLELVHRDVSPQNILVGVDGLSRVVDFGIAKAANRSSRTASGILKGKLPYMAPEQITIDPLDRRTDVYALSIVLWEMLAGRRLFVGENDWEIAQQIKAGLRTPPSVHNPAVAPELDQVVLRGAAKEPGQRYASALDMADALEAVAPVAPLRAVGRFVEALAAPALAERRQKVAEAESVKSDIATLSVPLGRESSAPRERSTARRAAPAEGTVLGGVFAKQRQQTPLSAPAVSSVDGPPTAATWSTAVQRRLSPPLIGVIAGASIAAAIGVVFLIVRLASDDPEPPVTAVEPAPLSTPAPAPAPTPEPAVADPAPTAPAEAPDASATEPESPPAAPPVATHVKKPPAPPPAPPSTQKPKPNCDPPFYFDENGDKRFRRECLNR